MCSNQTAEEAAQNRFETVHGVSITLSAGRARFSTSEQQSDTRSRHIEGRGIRIRNVYARTYRYDCKKRILAPSGIVRSSGNSSCIPVHEPSQELESRYSQRARHHITRNTDTRSHRLHYFLHYGRRTRFYLSFLEQIKQHIPQHKKGLLFSVLSTPFLLAGCNPNDPPMPLQWLVQTEADKQAWYEIASFINFFQDFNHNIKALGFDFFAWIFKILSSVVLSTPIWIFDNDWFRLTTQQISLLAISVVVLLTAWNGLKTGLRIGTSTPVKQIMTRFPLALIGAGFAPGLFVKCFEWINTVSSRITDLGYSHMASTVMLRNTLHTFSEFDFLALFAFDAALAGMAVPILLQNGRRWFDLLALGVSTPLALSAWIFTEYESYFSKWWSSVKKLSLTQLYQVVFITFIAVIMFSVKGVTTPQELFVKLLIIIGGLWRMTNPPAIVRSHLDRGGNAVAMTKQAANTATLKKVRENKEIQPPEKIKSYGKKNRLKRKGKLLFARLIQKIKK